MSDRLANNSQDKATLAALEAIAEVDRGAAPANFEDRLLLRTQSMLAPAPWRHASERRMRWAAPARLAASLALAATAVAATLLALPHFGSSPTAQRRAPALAASLEADLAPLLADGNPWGESLSVELLLLEIESALLDSDLEADWSDFLDGAAS